MAAPHPAGHLGQRPECGLESPGTELFLPPLYHPPALPLTPFPTSSAGESLPILCSLQGLLHSSLITSGHESGSNEVEKTWPNHAGQGQSQPDVRPLAAKVAALHQPSPVPQVLSDVLPVRKPGLCSADTPEDPQLAAPVQVLSLVSHASDTGGPGEARSFILDEAWASRVGRS